LYGDISLPAIDNKKSGFQLMGESYIKKIPGYDSLYDPNLAGYFKKQQILSHMTKVGLVKA
jgi:hypothetical protein